MAGQCARVSHVMERVTLLHVGAEVDAEILSKLCLPLATPAPPVGIVRRLSGSGPEETRRAEAVQIR